MPPGIIRGRAGDDPWGESLQGRTERRQRCSTWDAETGASPTICSTNSPGNPSDLSTSGSTRARPCFPRLALASPGTTARDCDGSRPTFLRKGSTRPCRRDPSILWRHSDYSITFRGSNAGRRFSPHSANGPGFAGAWSLRPGASPTRSVSRTESHLGNRTTPTARIQSIFSISKQEISCSHSEPAPDRRAIAIIATIPNSTNWSRPPDSNSWTTLKPTVAAAI